METWELIKTNAPLPVVSLGVTLFLLFLSKVGQRVIALLACALPPLALGFYAWYRDWDTAIGPLALFFGIIPGGLLAVGIHLWSSPDRPHSVARAMMTSVGCGFLPCVVAF